MSIDLRDRVAARDLDGVALLAVGSRRVLGRLLSLTYDADPGVAWGAVEAMGAAADRIADADPEFVRHHLRRLHWLMQEESGGVCWYAPQAMAEIVARRPELFSDWIPIVANLVRETAEEDLPPFLAGMLWAVGRLGRVAAGETAGVLPRLVAALDHDDPQVRGTAVWCLGRLARHGEIASRPALADDAARCTIFLDGALRALTVGGLVRAFLTETPAV
jgi:HEAT-like repeat